MISFTNFDDVKEVVCEQCDRHLMSDKMIHAFDGENAWHVCGECFEKLTKVEESMETENGDD